MQSCKLMVLELGELNSSPKLEKEFFMKKSICLFLVLWLCVFAFCACAPKTIAPETSLAPESSTPPEIIDPLYDPDLLFCQGLNKIGLTATLPDGVRFHDINFGEYKTEAETENYENIHVGDGITYTYKRLAEGYESFGITEDVPINTDGIYINIADGAYAVSTIRIFNLQGYQWQDGTAQSHKYFIAGFDENTIMTYDEIKPYIMYEDKTRIVIDSGELLGLDLRSEMEKHIEEREGNTEPVRTPDGEIVRDVFVHGTYEYLYSWLPEAFDLVVANKDKLIVPIEQ